MNRSGQLFLVLCFLSVNAIAQEKLSLKDAISIALEKNFDVQIARAGKQSTDLNNTAGAAGMMPSVTLEGGYNRTDLNLSQKLSDGRVIERNAARSETYSAAARLNWILFDGLTMFSRKARLESLSREAELTLRIQMETSIQKVIAAYYAVQLEEQRIRSLNELLQVDSIRIQLAVIRLESGNGSKLDLLNARLEKNNHQAQLLQEQANLIAQQENLNLLLGRDPSAQFTTADELTLTDIPKIDAGTRNADVRLLLAEQREQSAFQWLKETKGARLPVLSFNASYTYNQIENEAGFLLRNQNDGPGFGLNLQWNLFDGFRTSRTVKTAQFSYTISKLQHQQEQLLRQQAETKLQRDYALQRELVRTAELSHSFAQEILMVATERLKGGLGTSLEITEAQRNFEDAATRLYEAQYQAKLTETEMLKLTGKLITVTP